LIELFAAMVAVALENAELYAELESRLERIRTLSRLTRFASTCLDVDDVLPRIARAAAELTGATFATFWLADDRSRTVRLAATSDETIAAGLSRREMPYTQGSAGQVAAQRQPMTIDDVYQDGRSLNLDWWAQNGFKTSLTVPVMHGSTLLAVLSLNGREPFRLNVPQMEVLESFLAQAAAAIWNASLYTSVRRSQEQLQQIVDHSPTAISLKDRDGRYVLVNHRWQEMFWVPKHLPGDAPLGLTDHDLLPAGRADQIRQRDQHVITTGLPLEFESTSDEHGDRRTYLSVKFPLIDGTAQPYAVCTISTDITERKRWEEEIGGALQAQRIANEQLEQLNKAKSNFVSIVSHEFRSPLTGIQGFSELMRDSEMSVEEMREYSADINREAERLSRMIGELLDLDRMESGRMGLRLSAVDLSAIILQVVASAESRAPRHRLSVEMPPSLPTIAGDPDKLTQVVVNLVDNAIKYSPNGGSVVVGARTDGSLLRLSFRDQGLGIPADALESVFERYTRVESEQHQSIAGTGLGLPIVREIVELHGGRAWAESVVGLGSTFHVTLPLSDPAMIPSDERSESD
jgi:PAS domain S-box-containing protein